MRRLNSFSGNALSFYNEVLDSKKASITDPTYKTRLAGMVGSIQPLYDSYDDKFNANDLESLVAHPMPVNQREDLLKLYNYRNSVIQRLKIQLTTIEFNRVLSTCQCCTIGEVSAFDHVVPKGQFPEFAVNPKNLFPTCHKCNSHKAANWLAGGARMFLNLYLDELPIVQYLFANLDVDASGTVTPTFYLQNAGGINVQLFSLIESHYSHLHLCERFRQNSDSVVVNVANAVRAGRANLGKAQIVSQIIATSEANRFAFGFNYWRSILELSLANNIEFINVTYDSP